MPFTRFAPSLALGLLAACSGDDPADSSPPQDTAPAVDDTGSTDDTAPSSDDTASADDTGETGDPGIDTSAPPEAIAVSPSDPAIRYVGRWDASDPERPHVGWQGASASLRFVGTALSVTLEPGSRAEYFRVVVDGDHLGSTRFAAPAGEASYVLAEDLPPGEHTIELVKETYAGGNTSLLGFEVTGWALSEAPELAPRKIVFYGDSNLAGASLMHEQNQGGWDLVGSHFTYAGVTARAFGADYHNISTSGETLAGMPSRYDLQEYSDPGSGWDFSARPADVVVMNLGANDIYGPSEAQVRQRYADMLDLLRAAHPDAPIVVFNARGWDYDEPADYTADVVADYGDPDITAATFPWLFEQWHGCEYDHGGMARYLIEHLESVTGWSAAEPELMSGYGWDGGLANGGFEQIAPFGGYGWRYYTDAGVERVQDADGAHEGEHFLRLAEGAAVHQPNPASGGQTVAVSLWLRGAAPGDQLDVTVDFRDQAMWSTPVQSETTTFTLTDEWSQYSVHSVGLESGRSPIFHTRLTLRSARGAVEIDGLEMTTE